MTRRMADSITPGNLPHGFDLYGAYDDGTWPDAPAVAAAMAGKPVVRITVFARDLFGAVLDVENGDATAAQAVDWVLARRAAGADPTVYCSTSMWPAVKAAFAARAVPLPWWWRADYDRPTTAFPGDPREIAHQFIDHGPYDESIVADYWPGIDPPQPSKEDDTMYLAQGPTVGIFIVQGGRASHIPDMPDVQAYQAAGVPLIKLSDALINELAGA